MDGEVVPNGMTLACRAAVGAGGTFTAIAFPFPPLPLFQQKGSPKRRSVWWNCSAQQTANLRAYKAGEMELKGCPELRERAGESLWDPDAQGLRLSAVNMR